LQKGYTGKAAQEPHWRAAAFLDETIARMIRARKGQ
jgi:hypothetical protein